MDEPQIVPPAMSEEERKNVEFPADGELVTNVLGVKTGEVVVYDTDEDGNTVGWHKELV